MQVWALWALNSQMIHLSNAWQKIVNRIVVFVYLFIYFCMCLCLCWVEYKEYRLIVSMKQFDSIFHSIKLAIRARALQPSTVPHFQILLLIERVYVLVCEKLEKFITWKMWYFSPSRLCTACFVLPLPPLFYFIKMMSHYEINIVTFACVCVCVQILGGIYSYSYLIESAA